MQSTPRIMNEKTVAVIGAGPAGLVTARWLAHHGFEPVLFETSGGLGGQWNTATPTSATWSGMRTNTTRIMASFSDLEHAPDVAVYPRQDQMLDYLERYAFTFDLLRRIRFHTRVELLDRAANGRWRVVSTSEEGAADELFANVIVATGPHTAADVPAVSGIESFTGALGVAHTSQYDGAARYRGRSVLVGGCSISALEIAADLALGGATVISTYRRQRYIFPKAISGVPTDHVIFNRAAALAAEIAPPEALAGGLKALLLKANGSPEQYGAMAPDPDIMAASITQSQHFLPAVADGRITVRPWIDRIEGRTVHFSDGTRCEPDAILFGTGYRLSLPWLAPGVAETLDLDRKGIDLHAHTFHPNLPGLAFVGMYNLIGPHLPTLELQARWIVYAMAGLVPAPGRDEMAEGLALCRAMRERGQDPLTNHLAVLFARRAHVEPDLERWPELERALLFGPLSPISFRLQGPDALADAPARTEAAAALFGAISGKEYTSEELQLRGMIRVSSASAAA